ncbi:ABC transporter permease [Haloplanus aerogenes]|uniref:ABC transporter permease n=1 Tax=Haloplanus aerogenes TaxID=660522 RepID=A0A3M0CVJ1_9EURY|nr:ABC transporter permease [Haloplanus aerogenes]AZH26742.1 ABC transporter permease [Haloplanus aerogenes]RMB12987.1 NitT/TauT family transport system permease protein [Haloplanus aerogenes]
MSVAERVPFPGIVLPLSALIGAVAVWWALTVALAIPPFLLPSPAAVAARLVGNPDLYLTNAVETLRKILVGGAAGIAVGFSLALLVWAVPLLKRAIYPYLVAARVLPKIAVAPIFLIYFGVGFETAILFVALIVFFPVVVGTAAGLDRTPESHLDLLRSVDAGAVQTFLHVRLPHALPDVFAGVKQSVTLAVVGAVVAEWILSNDGLGSLILVASENVQVDVMLAALTVLLCVGLCLYGGVALCYRAVAWD